jgi:alpha-beta hydrolase superfamily lysophospholipase
MFSATIAWSALTVTCFTTMDQPIEQQAKPTILLVHGAWADSSSWNGVVDLLFKDGYTVRATGPIWQKLADS